jgi:hypothetical protein
MSDLARTPQRNDQLRFAALVVVALIVAGVLIGLLWAWWTPAGPPGVELKAGTVQINESETFAAGDGRFAVLTGLLGLIAPFLAWFARSSRGPWVAFALGLGGLAGAWVAGLVGHLAGGGTNSGPPNTEIPHLPLNVHMTGLIMVEGALAVLVYSVLTAFAVDDDLGRPDPVRDALRPVALVGAGYGYGAPSPGGPVPGGPTPGDSVQPQNLSQDGWAHGDAPGLAQQYQFPPQDPGQGA